MQTRTKLGIGAALAAALGVGVLTNVGSTEVQDWKTGEWGVLAAGYQIDLDLDEKRATAADQTVPIQIQFDGNVMQVRIPGVRAGLLQLEHAEGRLMGTLTAQGRQYPAAGQRPSITVVQTVEQDDCTFAQYSDGSWGVAPYLGPCHQALVAHVGDMQYVAREYTP